MPDGLRAGIELGGTKVVVAVGSGPDDLRDVRRIPTTTPEETLDAVAGFLRGVQRAGAELVGVGVASFGPVGVHPGTAEYGSILATPKPGWAGTDVVAAVRSAVPGVPVGFDTDVNAAARAEHMWGAGRDVEAGPVLYLTIGTGIGGGLSPAPPGISHPEMGHVPVPHDRVDDPYPGGCPFHGDCWEGLAAGPALAARWGVPAEELPPDHPAWTLQAQYVAAGLQALVLTLMPARVVLGGGVSAAPGLLPRARRELVRRLAGYVARPELADEGVDRYVVAPHLGDRAGVLGAMALTLEA